MDFPALRCQLWITQASDSHGRMVLIPFVSHLLDALTTSLYALWRMWDVSDTLVTHAFPEREVWLKSCGDGEPKGSPTVRLWFPRKRFAAQRGLWTSRVSISWEFLRNSRFSDPTLMWNENLHFSILQMGSASFKLRTELGCVFLT